MAATRWAKRALWITLGIALAGMAPGLGFAPARANGEAGSGDESAVTVSRSEIRARAESMPLDRRTDVDKRIRTTVERVNRETLENGQAKVAQRLAAEFKVTLDGLLDEKSEYGLSWGEMVIAHTLVANAGVKVELRDLAALRAEGLTWGAIAYGMQYHLEDLEELIKSEGKVAMGFPRR